MHTKHVLLIVIENARCIAASILVVDGDTIRLGSERIRIVGIDTPELGKGARCAAEAHAAENARRALQNHIRRGPVEIVRQGTDRYYRTLARILIDGKDVAEMMISEGYGRPYFGGRREGWC